MTNDVTATTTQIQNNDVDDMQISLSSKVPVSYNNISINDVKLAMNILSLQQKSSAKTSEEAKQKPYQFWSTQPVPKMGNFLYSI